MRCRANILCLGTRQKRPYLYTRCCPSRMWLAVSGLDMCGHIFYIVRGTADSHETDWCRAIPARAGSSCPRRRPAALFGVCFGADSKVFTSSVVLCKQDITPLCKEPKLAFGAWMVWTSTYSELVHIFQMWVLTLPALHSTETYIEGSQERVYISSKLLNRPFTDV